MYSLRGDLSRSASSVLGVKRSDVDDTVLRSVANSGLVVLDVSGNGLGDEFAEQLAAFIAYDKWLRRCVGSPDRLVSLCACQPESLCLFSI